jgi:polar amino acid transport system substrate-binding protein
VFRRLLPAGVLALALVLAGCGESEEPGGNTPASALPSVSADPALAALVPDAIKADGKIIVGIEPGYAPAEFLDTDGKTVIGFDVDLFRAVVAKLGLTAEFVPTTFGDIIPGVESGKYEVGVSAITINPERKEQALMVSYFTAGTQWAAKKGNPAGVSPDDPCGKRIAVQRDTVQVDDITLKSDACVTAGKPTVTINPYPGQDQAANSVVSGKDDAMLADSPVTAYAVKQSNGQLELIGEVYGAAPYGYVVKKGDAAFAAALRQSLAALMAQSPSPYVEILTAWGVETGAIADPQINP